jgi:hypothetical protein
MCSVSVNLSFFFRIVDQNTYMEEEITTGKFVTSYILHDHVRGNSVHSSKSMLVFIIAAQLWLEMLREWTPNIHYSKTNEMHSWYSVYYELTVSTCFEHYLLVFRSSAQTALGILRACYVCWLHQVQYTKCWIILMRFLSPSNTTCIVYWNNQLGYMFRPCGDHYQASTVYWNCRYINDTLLTGSRVVYICIYNEIAV